MDKNHIFNKNSQNGLKNRENLRGQSNFMGKHHIQELYKWKVAYIAYFQDRVKKMSSSVVYSVFWQFLGTSQRQKIGHIWSKMTKNVIFGLEKPKMTKICLFSKSSTFEL